MKQMLVVVACMAVVFWAWRYSLDTDPTSRAIRALHSPWASKRLEAARSLGAQGMGAREAVSALVECLVDRDPAVRAQAARSLAQGMLAADDDAALSALLTALRDPQPDVREAVMNTLGGFRPQDALAALIAGLGDRDPGVRIAAANGLRKAGSSAASAVPALREAVNRGDPALQGAAVLALISIGPDSALLVPLLVAAMANPDPAVRKQVVTRLGHELSARTAASRSQRNVGLLPQGVSALRHPAEDPDPNVRAEMIRSLSSIGADIPYWPTVRNRNFILSELEIHAREGGEPARRLAEISLMGLASALARETGPDLLGTAGFLPLLEPALGSPDVAVRRTAATAIKLLTRISPVPFEEMQANLVEEIQLAFVECFADTDANVRMLALSAFVDASASDAPLKAALASDVRPVLRAALNDRDIHVRVAAAKVLGFALLNTGEQDADLVAALHSALPDVVATLDDRDPAQRMQAIRAISLFNSRLDVVVPALCNVLDRPDAPEQELAARQLSMLPGPWKGAALEQAITAVPVLVRALKHPNASVRLSACETLCRLSRKVESARAALQEALVNPDPRVRSRARSCLGPDAARLGAYIFPMP